ncbi:hypothetical protein DSO57_1003103 [Entomophthora muscae]|uniref:Uncharacterized protein n=1 Tax=Entomophthora muscae TaxID=34485 RepID=A0ACC2UTV7_9FUNG|nr:hypothetical protein DSO57_1003103 [Entomophthora muscae]
MIKINHHFLALGLALLEAASANLYFPLKRNTVQGYNTNHPYSAYTPKRGHPSGRSNYGYHFMPNYSNNPSSSGNDYATPVNNAEQSNQYSPSTNPTEINEPSTNDSSKTAGQNTSPGKNDTSSPTSPSQPQVHDTPCDEADNEIEDSSSDLHQSPDQEDPCDETYDNNTSQPPGQTNTSPKTSDNKEDQNSPCDEEKEEAPYPPQTPGQETTPDVPQDGNESPTEDENQTPIGKYPTKPNNNSTSGDYEAQALLDAVNAERKKQNLTEYVMNNKLNAAAQKHSKYQSDSKTMSHTGEGGSDPSKRCQAEGYGQCGENVAMGQKSVAQVMESWMNSPGHKANILSSMYTEFGAARVGDVWTQNFGSSGGSYNPSSDGGDSGSGKEGGDYGSGTGEGDSGAGKEGGDYGLGTGEGDSGAGTGGYDSGSGARGAYSGARGNGYNPDSFGKN